MNHKSCCCHCCQEPCLELHPAYFNAVMQGGYQDIAPEENVNFLLAFQSGDFSFTPNTAEIDELTNAVRTELTGMFITSIPAGATVVLRNKSSTIDYLAGTGVDNQAVNHASILLQRIA